ncbi:phage baseplate protein [Kosakonia sacchari]|uniref:phage baseplate protein n=1 Tax=Kosakonia sacchari TaxID=1158459 RepID=UPI0015848F99|nr:hypothetical protein [Kosakonia sacchari]NUL35037.1 hypothetical protein [Kosakonia sacchari]
MAGDTYAAIGAPQDPRAVMVFSSGEMITLRIKTREELSVKRTIARGKLETGYKISDGTVEDPQQIDIEGIITGTNLPYEPNNMVLAANHAQQINSAYQLKEFVSVYTSFIALSQCGITSLSILAEPDKNCYTVKLTAEKVDTITFRRSQTIKAKTSNAKGKGKVTTGKKSATPVEKKRDKEKKDLGGFLI